MLGRPPPTTVAPLPGDQINTRSLPLLNLVSMYRSGLLWILQPFLQEFYNEWNGSHCDPQTTNDPYSCKSFCTPHTMYVVQNNFVASSVIHISRSMKNDEPHNVVVFPTPPSRSTVVTFVAPFESSSSSSSCAA
jgi:hypothetical protein